MIRLAKKISQRSSHRVFHHAAIVMRGGAVVATGYNHGEVHAETHALNGLWPSSRKGTTVWCVRTTKTGKLAMAKPCVECEEMMRAAGVKKIVYSTTAGTMETIRYR